MFLFNILLNVADWIKSAKKPLDKQLIYRGQQADNLAKLWQEFFCPSYFDSTNFLRGRKTKKAIYKRKARLKFESNSIEKN